MDNYRKFYNGDPAKGLSDFDRKQMKQKNTPKKIYCAHKNKAVAGRARRMYVKSHINQYKDDLECIEDMYYPGSYSRTGLQWFDVTQDMPKVFKFRNF